MTYLVSMSFNTDITAIVMLLPNNPFSRPANNSMPSGHLIHLPKNYRAYKTLVVLVGMSVIFEVGLHSGGGLATT